MSAAMLASVRSFEGRNMCSSPDCSDERHRDRNRLLREHGAPAGADTALLDTADMGVDGSRAHAPDDSEVPARSAEAPCGTPKANCCRYSWATGTDCREVLLRTAAMMVEEETGGSSKAATQESISRAAFRETENRDEAPAWAEAVRDDR
jgi:hypothetical protein